MDILTLPMDQLLRKYLPPILGVIIIFFIIFGAIIPAITCHLTKRKLTAMANLGATQIASNIEGIGAKQIASNLKKITSEKKNEPKDAKPNNIIDRKKMAPNDFSGFINQTTDKKQSNASDEIQMTVKPMCLTNIDKALEQARPINPEKSTFKNMGHRRERKADITVEISKQPNEVSQLQCRKKEQPRTKLMENQPNKSNEARDKEAKAMIDEEFADTTCSITKAKSK